MDLSKAFATVNHYLLKGKLNTYGFTEESLKLTKSCYSNRWQRTNINTSFSSLIKLFLGVPHGSLLFKICINDLLFLTESTNVCNYADDTIFHVCDLNLEILRITLDARHWVAWK